MVGCAWVVQQAYKPVVTYEGLIITGFRARTLAGYESNDNALLTVISGAATLHCC